jgi:hypothetical protein
MKEIIVNLLEKELKGKIKKEEFEHLDDVNMIDDEEEREEEGDEQGEDMEVEDEDEGVVVIVDDKDAVGE